MTAKEFMEEQARRFGMLAHPSHDGDFDLRVFEIEGMATSGSDVIQLCSILDEAGYVCSFKKDNSIGVKAPHKSKHGPLDRGWGCTHGLTVMGCEVFKIATSPFTTGA